MDGALGSRGAAFIEPYSDYDTRGLMRYSVDEITPMLLAALKAGIQVEIHAIGGPRIEFYAAVARKDLSGFSDEGWHPELAVTRE